MNKPAMKYSCQKKNDNEFDKACISKNQFIGNKKDRRTH